MPREKSATSSSAAWCRRRGRRCGSSVTSLHGTRSCAGFCSTSRGSEFDCRIEAETSLGGAPASVPQVTGRAWITGTHQHMLDPEDPWPGGYRLADTWPMMSGRQ